MSESHDRTIRKFNPGTFQGDDEIIGQFVVREHELATVLEVLRGNIDADSCQHALIVAPRGRGKTMLLARVAAELRTNLELSKHLLPIRFMEESHEIFNLADFWLDVLFYFARAIGIEKPELARSLRDTHADLTSRWRERELDERARAAVLEAADRLGKRLVLMVENLQELCANVNEDFGWKLRKTLQSEPQIMLIATATTRFESLEDAQEPFFELFRIICLQPLNTAQCRRLWQTVSGDTIGGRRIRPLEILTGGDPRLLVIVAEFARHRSMRQLMEGLVKLIDDHTEYFRGYLEAVAKTERRVYLATVDLWQRSSTGEVAARARMDVRTVSTMLGRLVERGAVIVYGAGRKRQYAAAQRLYSIYYKLRRERDEAAIVQNLLHFMAEFYSDSEMVDLFDTLKLEALQSPTILAGIERAQSDVPRLSEFTDGLARAAQNMVNTAIERIERADYEAAITACDEVIARFGASEIAELQVIVMHAFTHKGLAQGRRGNPRLEIETNREALARFFASAVPTLQHQIAISLFNTGAAHIRLEDHCGAIATYDELVRRFRTSDDRRLRVRTAKSLINKGYSHGQLGDHDMELNTYREVLEQYGPSDVPELQIEVATALFNTGVVQARSRKHVAAMATFDQVVARYGTSNVPQIQSRIARTLVNIGVEQVELGEYPSAITTFDNVVERYRERDGQGLEEWVAQSLTYKAATQDRIGNTEGAIATSEEVLARFGESEEAALRVHVAGALVQKGATLGGLGRHADAIATNDEVFGRYRCSDMPELQELVTRAMNNKGVSQALLGNASAAIVTSDEIVARFGASDAPELRAQVAAALFHKGMTQIKMGLAEDALGTSDELEHRRRALADDTRAAFKWKARYLRMSALLAQGRRTDAIDAFCSVYGTLVPDKETMIPEMIRAVANLVAAGVPEHELVAILSLEPQKSAVLAPLIIALRQLDGEAVRAPAEVLEVAADVRKRIDEARPTGA